jgi:hypothetical protein
MRASYYQNFDADPALDVPGEGYGGWKTGEIDPGNAALVVMHAWDCGTREEFPGWYRCVEYIPRSQEICRTVFPPLLARVRETGFPLFHVVGGGSYYKELPGYRHAVALAGPTPSALPCVGSDPALAELRRFKAEHVYVGRHNEADVQRGFERIDFAAETRPLDTEGIAENGHQLHALCAEAGVNHLIYTGFAINWCILLSPGGMAEMSGRGFMCSAIRQATSAVENRETAREERCKEIALWRVALAYGFVFDVSDFIQGISVR